MVTDPMKTGKQDEQLDPMNQCNSNTIVPYTMNTKQAAVFLGCSEYMIRELCRRKELPHSRLGNKRQTRLLFTQKALIEWLEKQERRNWR